MNIDEDFFLSLEGFHTFFALCTILQENVIKITTIHGYYKPVGINVYLRASFMDCLRTVLLWSRRLMS